MIGLFPTPGKDELLYSLVSRYGAMAGQRVACQLIQDIFGTPVGVTAVDLPRHIQRMVERLPSGLDLDQDRLIEDHTLYPYMVRFAPPAVAAAVRAYMVGDVDERPARLGVTSAKFPTRERLMLCRECVREDSVDMGLGTWRRIHQLPGVLVCPHHGRPLCESIVPRLNRVGKGALIAITAEIVRRAKPLHLPRGSQATLIEFASRTQTLLDLRTQPCDVDQLQRRLRDLLHGYSWTRAPSLMHTSALVGDFGACPAIRTLMAAMGIQWSSAQLATAINRLFYRKTVTKHPLMVLMLLEMAGASVVDLLDPTWQPPAAQASMPTRPNSITVVRDDLPCGNPACHRFQGSLKAALRQVDLGAAPVRANCPACSFAYLRDLRRPGGICVVETGPLWDDLLVRTLSNPATGVRAASRALGVGVPTIQRHARRLGLWREEWTDRPKLQLRSETRADRLLARHREQWTRFRTTGHVVPAKQMPKEAFNAYRYLLREDRKWLESNHPLRRRRD